MSHPKVERKKRLDLKKRKIRAFFLSIETKKKQDIEIDKEADEWRQQAEKKKPKSRFSFLTKFLSRKEPAFFVVDQEVPPRLYRLRDDEAGEITFELAEVEEGGTTVKATYEGRARSLVQNFKAKMPVKILGANVRTCPSCGKDMRPEFKSCPYCGSKLG